MNQKWYRAGITKAILIITAHIMVVVMAVCYMHTVLSPAIREEVCDGDPAEKYKDSSDFASRIVSLTTISPRSLEPSPRKKSISSFKTSIGRSFKELSEE